MKCNWKQHFFRFLKENNVFYAYTSLTQERFNKHIYGRIPLDEYIDTNEVIKGWAWRNTEQGVFFWQEINAKWLCYVCENYDSFSLVGSDYKNTQPKMLDYERFRTRLVYYLDTAKHVNNISHRDRNFYEKALHIYKTGSVT